MWVGGKFSVALLSGGQIVLMIALMLSVPIAASAQNATVSRPVVLRGLNVAPSIEEAASAMDGVQVPGLFPVDRAALQTGLSALLGRPIGRELLNEIRQVVTESFVNAGRPFIDVGFPQQDITEGRLRVVVQEYRVGQVAVSGNNWFTDRQVTEAAGLTPGETIDKNGLDSRLAAFGASPFVKVTPDFQPGKAPGTTDVTLRVDDRLPVQVSATYHDTGAASTGWDRFDLGVRWGNVAHSGGTLGYTLSSSSDFYNGRPGSDLLYEGVPPRFMSQTVTAELPLDGGARVSLSGGYTRQSPTLGRALGSIGTTTTFSADYTRPADFWPATWIGGTDQEVGIGVSVKRSNNNLSFGGQLVQRGFTVVAEISLHASTNFTNSLGRLHVMNTLTASPGGLTRENSDTAFQPLGSSQSGTPGAHARYVYDQLVLTQMTPLPRDYGLLLRATLQASSSTLLGSEQMSIAGMDAVRGYQEFGVAGSQGVLLSAELRGPSFSPSTFIGLADRADQAQLHVFLDAGRAWNPTGSQTAPAAQSTASFGAGGTLALADNFNMRLEQGWQILRSNRPGANGAFLHAEVSATW